MRLATALARILATLFPARSAFVARFNSDQNLARWLPMNAAPSAVNFGLLFGLSFFLGLAFEDFFAHAGNETPRGIRAFPMLALAGGMLYLFDPVHLLPFTGGLLVLGAWLADLSPSIFANVTSKERRMSASWSWCSTFTPTCSVQYTLALPDWVAVGATVAAVLLLTGRERLHELARRVEMKEVALCRARSLILTGLVLPLLPSEPVTTLTAPNTAASLVRICSSLHALAIPVIWSPSSSTGVGRLCSGWRRSVASTLRQPLCRPRPSGGNRRVAAAARASWDYSRHRDHVSSNPAIVAVFNLELARQLVVPLVGLSVAAMLDSARCNIGFGGRR